MVNPASDWACGAAFFVSVDTVKLAHALRPEIDAEARLMAYKMSLMSDITVNAEAFLPCELM